MPKLFTKPGFQELMEFGKMEKYSAEWQNTEFQFNRGGSWFSKLEIFRLRSFEISRNCRRKYLLKYLAIIIFTFRLGITKVFEEVVGLPAAIIVHVETRVRSGLGAGHSWRSGGHCDCRSCCYC